MTTHHYNITPNPTPLREDSSANIIQSTSMQFESFALTYLTYTRTPRGLFSNMPASAARNRTRHLCAPHICTEYAENRTRLRNDSSRTHTHALACNMFTCLGARLFCGSLAFGCLNLTRGTYERVPPFARSQCGCLCMRETVLLRGVLWVVLRQSDVFATTSGRMRV